MCSCQSGGLLAQSFVSQPQSSAHPARRLPRRGLLRPGPGRAVAACAASRPSSRASADPAPTGPSRSCRTVDLSRCVHVLCGLLPPQKDVRSSTFTDPKQLTTLTHTRVTFERVLHNNANTWVDLLISSLKVFRHLWYPCARVSVIPSLFSRVRVSTHPNFWNQVE